MDQVEGNMAFYGSNTPAWHKKGTTFDRKIDMVEACHIASPFPYFKLATQAIMIDEQGNKNTLDLMDNFAIIRGDGKEIGKVGKDFELLQPWEGFEGFQTLIDQGLVELEAGGTLCDGKRFWILAKVIGAEADIVKGDSIKGYVLFYTGFDGSLSIGLMNTSIRVVCMNTLKAAMNRGGGIRIRHTKNAKVRYEAGIDTIAMYLKGFQGDVDTYRALANKRLSRQAQQQYIRDLFIEKDKQDKVDEIPTQTLTKVNTVIELLDTQRGLELVPAIRGTAWQAYNAVSEYVTHVHGRNDDTRLNGQWFGESANLNRKALEMAIAM